MIIWSFESTLGYLENMKWEDNPEQSPKEVFHLEACGEEVIIEVGEKLGEWGVEKAKYGDKCHPKKEWCTALGSIEKPREVRTAVSALDSALKKSYLA